jgi:hypothetical protein
MMPLKVNGAVNASARTIRMSGKTLKAVLANKNPVSNPTKQLTTI